MSWIKNHKFIFFVFLAGFLLVIAGFLPTFLKFYKKDLIIIKYVYPIGIVSLGSFYNLVLFFLNSILIFLVNFVLAKRFEERDIFLGKFVAVLNFLVCLLIFIYFISIIKIN